MTYFGNINRLNQLLCFQSKIIKAYWSTYQILATKGTLELTGKLLEISDRDLFIQGH